MMDSLDVLRRQLALANANFTVHRFGDVRPMKQLADRVVTKFGAGSAPASEAISNAINNFISTGKLIDFRTLKLVCYGAANRSAATKSNVLENDSLLTRLLSAVETVKHRTRQFRRCCQGLLSVVFAFRPYEAKERASVSGWVRVRAFLAEHLRYLLGNERQPDWVMALREHENILSSTPCEKYAKEFLAGKNGQFESMCSRLGIGKNSWIRDDVVLAAMRAATALPGAKFVSHLDFLLMALKDAPNVRLTGVRLLLDHYATLGRSGEHILLRTNAIELMGNPLLVANGQRWRDVSQEARKMVGDWLKLKVIEQFFELLSHDGATDKRRVNFWSSYVPVIENIWIVFGLAAQSKHNRDFDSLRQLLGDNGLRLEGGSRTNNAFIMKIGQQYVIEFGETGNACYVYNEDSLPFSLLGTLRLTQLKLGYRSLHHRDGLQRWEDKFCMELRLPPIGYARVASSEQPKHTFSGGPSVATPATPFGPPEFEHAMRAFCAERGLRLEDKRARGGPLIIYADSRNTKVSGILGQWGFRYDATSVTWVKAS